MRESGRDGIKRRRRNGGEVGRISDFLHPTDMKRSLCATRSPRDANQVGHGYDKVEYCSVQIARDVHDLGDLTAVLNVSGGPGSPCLAAVCLFNTFSFSPSLCRNITLCVPPLSPKRLGCVFTVFLVWQLIGTILFLFTPVCCWHASTATATTSVARSPRPTAISASLSSFFSAALSQPVYIKGMIECFHPLPWCKSLEMSRSFQTLPA